MHRICLVSQIVDATGIVCRDTTCAIITVPQEPVIALCDTHRTRFRVKLGNNFYGEFEDNSSYGDSTYWYSNGSWVPDTITAGPGTIAQYQFNGPGPHRICMVSVWYPFPNNRHIVCRDTICRNVLFPVPKRPVISTLGLELAPNPTTSFAALRYPAQPKRAHFTLTDLQGNIIKTWHDDGGGTTTVYTEDLPHGIYLLSMPMEHGKAVIKLLKQ
jgi:hypothetical protein